MRMLFFLALLTLGFLPFQWSLSLGEGSFPLVRFLSLILIFGAGVVLLTDRKQLFPSLAFIVCLLGWLGMSTLSLLLSDTPALGLRKLFFLWNFFPLIFVWYVLGVSDRVFLRLIKMLIVGAVACVGVALTFFVSQFFFEVGPVFHFLTDTLLPFFIGEHLGTLVAAYPSLLVNIGGMTWLRATAFFPDPHVAAYFFGISACLSVGMWLETRSRWYLIAGLLLIFTDLLTFARGGYLGLLSALMIFLGFTPQLRRQWVILFGLGSILTICFFLWGMPVVERLTSTFTLADASSTERLILWQTAWDTWLTHPWFGVGLGQYAEWVQPGVGANIPYYAHNLFLDIAVEIGMIGLLCFLGMIGLAGYQAVRLKTGLAIGTLAALVLYLTHSFFETPLFSVHITLLLTLLLTLPFVAIRQKTQVE